MRVEMVAASALAIISSVAQADTLTDKLKLNDKQMALYLAWRTAARPDPARTQAVVGKLPDRPTFVDISDHLLKMNTENLARTNRANTAVHTFYESLTAQQRLDFDDALTPKGEESAPGLPPLPEELGAAKKDPFAPYHTHPSLISGPDGDAFSYYYPPRAKRAGIEGAAMVSCTVTTMGLAVDCSVASESPKGYGFGNATIEIASLFRFHPAKAYGLLLEEPITVPLRWTLLSGSAAKVAPNR